MPNRILRDWTASKKVDKLSFQEEVLFTRLIMKADDYGNFYADEAMVKSLCFPRKPKVKVNDISDWLKRLKSEGLIRFYESGGDRYVHIVDFRQRLDRKKRLAPESPYENADNETETSTQNQMQPNGNQAETIGAPETNRNEVEVESEVEGETETKVNPKTRTHKTSSSKLDKLKHSFRDSEYFEKEKFSAALDSSPPPYSNANTDFYYDAALNGSDSKGYKYLDWMAAIKNWMRNDISKDQFKTKFSEPKKINGSTSKFDRSQQITDHNQDQLRRIVEGGL